MIVTRRRRKPFPWKRLLIPAGIVALLAGAFAWPVSRSWIAGQPAVSQIAKPFDAASQMQTISAQNGQIAALQKQLAGLRTQINDRDKQISNLQSQLNSAQQDAAMANAARPRSAPAADSPAAAPGAVAQTADLAQQATSDMRRTASVWSAMDADAAAKVVQRLPDAYVARIFAIMPADSVGAILESLPAAYAARLTQERPELNH